MKAHWNGFLDALDKNKKPIDNNSVYQNTSSKIGVSGFLDLKPTNIQPNYDAMNSTWLGVEATNKAFLNQKHVSTSVMPLNK